MKLKDLSRPLQLFPLYAFMSSPRTEKRMLVLGFSGFGTKARAKGEKATEPEKERNGDAREKKG